MPDLQTFIIRVYGLLMSSRREILIAHEYHYDMPMVKFPGGGLHFGEGIADGLRRELVEELGVEMGVGLHFHTTDFFARSIFNPNHQIIGVYYLVEAETDLDNRFREPLVHPDANGGLAFRWIGLDELRVIEMTFPTDRQALEKFLDNAGKGLIRWPERT